MSKGKESFDSTLSADPMDWKHPEAVYLNPEFNDLGPEDRELLMLLAGGIAELRVTEEKEGQ